MTRENLLIMDCLVEGEAGLLELNGELIAETRFEVERLLREGLEGGMRRVIIRCRSLGTIDSAGFSTLLGALHRYRRLNISKFLNASPPALMRWRDAIAFGLIIICRDPVRQISG